MPNLKQIAEAFGALAGALPGVGGTSVHLHGCSAATMRLFVESGATLSRYENDASTKEWDCAALRAGASTIYAYSEHRPIVRAAIDQDAASKALSLAETTLAEEAH